MPGSGASEEGDNAVDVVELLLAPTDQAPNVRHLRPLCELVDCTIQVLKAPDSTGEGPQYVEPPDQKRLGEGNCLKGLSWLMKLL